MVKGIFIYIYTHIYPFPIRQSPPLSKNKTIILTGYDLLAICPSTRWCKLKCMKNVCMNYMLSNQCPSVSTVETTQDGSRWRIVERTAAAEPHTQPHSQHSIRFRTPSITIRNWPVCWYAPFGVAAALRGSAVTTEGGEAKEVQLRQLSGNVLFDRSPLRPFLSPHEAGCLSLSCTCFSKICTFNCATESFWKGPNYEKIPVVWPKTFKPLHVLCRH